MITAQQSKQLESIVKEITKNPQSICHDFGHLSRTAEGAAWFVRVSGGSEHEQILARASGLLHDIVRPTTKKVDHAGPSAAKSEEILAKLDFSAADRSEIVRAIKDHSMKGAAKLQSLVHESVFFSDKMFEQLGAQVIFRRGMWLAESQDTDWSKGSEYEVKAAYYEKRALMLNASAFPARFRSAFDYQFKLVTDALVAFNIKQDWAVNIDHESFEAGKKRIYLEDFLRNYKPIGKEDARYKEEALAYIEGRLFEKFEKMIKNKI